MANEEEYFLGYEVGNVLPLRGRHMVRPPTIGFKNAFAQRAENFLPFGQMRVLKRFQEAPKLVGRTPTMAECKDELKFALTGRCLI
jgi:hypothetical protein